MSPFEKNATCAVCHRSWWSSSTIVTLRSSKTGSKAEGNLVWRLTANYLKILLGGCQARVGSTTLAIKDLRDGVLGSVTRPDWGSELGVAALRG